MREMGWDIEDCVVYDTEKAKSMTEDEAAAYRTECRTKRRQKKSGLDSKTYKAKKEIEKMEKEREKARLSRDLALAAAQQAKQQTAAICFQKEVLEAEITDLQAKVDSYPADLHDRLDALSAAANAASTDGPLIEFLQKIKVNQKKPDGSTIRRTVYDVWEEYHQKQEQKLAAQSEQVQQEALEVQRRLPSFQSTTKSQHGNSYSMDF